MKNFPGILFLLLAIASMGWCWPSCPTDTYLLVPRTNTLVLDLGLFLFDVGSDLVNGVNFIGEGNTVWGGLIIGLTFLPMAVLLTRAAVTWLKDEIYRKNLLRVVLLSPLLLALYLLAVAVGTPCYILYTIYVYGRKVIDPARQETNRGIPRWFIFLDDLETGEGDTTALFKGLEGLLEASPQAHVVLFGVLVTGLSQSRWSSAFQVFGLATSVASVAKNAAEWHLFTRFNTLSERPLPPSLPAILKAALCLLPHFLFRSSSLVLLAAFLRLYALIPILSYIFAILVIILAIRGRNLSSNLDITIPTFLMVLFTPSVANPVQRAERRLLEFSLLAAPLVLLPYLLTLFLLPHLISEDSLLSALPQFSLPNSTIPFCLPTPTDPGSSCQIQFSYHLYCKILPALALLGFYCLLEGILIQFKNKDGSTSIPTPYRWLDAPWQRDLEAYFKEPMGVLFQVSIIERRHPCPEGLSHSQCQV